MTNEIERQGQLYDDGPCFHRMLCEKHKRCIDRMAKACPFRCQVCEPGKVQHA